MSDASKQERIEELLRKSLLGEELVNTQFHLFSARSSTSRVLKPRVLCANNVLLARSSKYFLDLLGSDVNPSDPSLIDLTDDNDVPSDGRIGDYGYGSDSDLDDCNDPSPPTNPKAPKQRSTSKGDESSDGESVSSDMFVMSAEQPKEDNPFSGSKAAARSGASSETAARNPIDDKTLKNQAALRLRSLGSRHIFVKDTAFQTWYTLLYYLYTNRFNFLPLSSSTPAGQPIEASTSSLDEPRCSAKSMYRLASKVGLDDLRDEAFSYIQSSLTENNILKELSCSIVSKHPELLEMELDVLFSHIASPPVVSGFPDLARRVASKQLPHGADVIVGVHTRLLKQFRPLSLRVEPPLHDLVGRPKLVKVEESTSNTSGVEDGPSQLDERDVLSDTLAPNWDSHIKLDPPQESSGVATPAFTFRNDPSVKGYVTSKAASQPTPGLARVSSAAYKSMPQKEPATNNPIGFSSLLSPMSRKDGEPNHLLKSTSAKVDPTRRVL